MAGPAARQAIREGSTLGRQRQADREAHEGTKFRQQVPVSAHSSASDGAGGEPSDAGMGGGREDACLGLLAEAFADDLDVLRKDVTFTGSSKNIAAMADMMRCLASGLDSTEQALLLENATR